MIHIAIVGGDGPGGSAEGRIPNPFLKKTLIIRARVWRLHSELLNSHLNICPQSVPHETALTFKLSSPHLDVRKLASLPLAL